MAENNKTVALVGIAATAIVGIAGAASSWLISRRDQNTERTLAHQARVYDRRADAYVDALRLLQSLDNRYFLVASKKHLKPKIAHILFAEERRKDILIRSRLRAYGTNTAYHLYDRAMAYADLTLLEVELRKKLDFVPIEFNTGQFEQYFYRFAKVVHAEVG